MLLVFFERLGIHQLNQVVAVLKYSLRHFMPVFFGPYFLDFKGTLCFFFPLCNFFPPPPFKGIKVVSSSRVEIELKFVFLRASLHRWRRLELRRRVTEPHIHKFYLYTNTLGHLHTKGRNNRPSSVSFSPSLSLPLLRSLLGLSWRSHMTGGILR